mgnify:CR=1 FL=1
MKQKMAQNGRVLPTLAALLTLLIGSAALAAPETIAAALPLQKVTPPAVKDHALGSLRVSGACDGTVAVFSLRNAGARWTQRGLVRIHDADTGAVVNQRSLLMGNNQSASFRVKEGLVPASRYRVSVSLADGRVTVVKSFSGRCLAPSHKVRTAER